MNVSLTSADITTIDTGLLVLPIAGTETSEALLNVEKATGIEISTLAAEEQFKGEPGQDFLLRGVSNMGASRVLLVGIGTEDSREYDTLRAAGTSAARQAKASHVTNFTIVAPSDRAAALAMIEGAVLGTYHFDRFISKSDGDYAGFETLQIATQDDLSADLAERQTIIEGVNLARTLVNDTPNHMTPIAMAQKAKDIASEFGLKAKVLDESALESGGFNLIMGVGKGSDNPPRLIHLTYTPSGEVKRKIAFVGKGVTFDTGGYNLKPGGALLAMHSDMGGAAAVLGAARAIGELKPEGVEVHFVCPSAENSISGNAMRPQDIIRGYGKQTVEIHNTDAEGRLILADALAYIQEYEVDTIIDLATLTGACVVALGESTAGLFSSNDALSQSILDAAAACGEDIWRMPLNKKLDVLLDTPTADMKNVGPRWGGAITAALFLNRWVKIDGWAHLDIAGPAYTEKETSTNPPGGTGFAVATLVEFTKGVSNSL